MGGMLSPYRRYFTRISISLRAKLRKATQTKLGNAQKVVAEDAFFYLGKMGGVRLAAYKLTPHHGKRLL